MPLLHSHSDKIRLRRRKNDCKLKEKQKKAPYSEDMMLHILASNSFGAEHVKTSCVNILRTYMYPKMMQMTQILSECLD